MQLKNITIGICTGMMALILSVASCSDMNELSDRFLDQGEIIYASKVDTASIGSGNGRVKIEMRIKTNRIKTVRIYWNDRADSLDVSINNQPGVFSTIIGNLAERNYIFNLVSFDVQGNKSLKYELSGQAFGENYQASMVNRSISSISASNIGNKIAVWGNIDTMTLNAKYSEISYTNLAGNTVLLKVPVSIKQTTIPDPKPGTTIEYRTAYIPDKMGVDTFYTALKSYTSDGYFMLLKSEWALRAFSDQHPSSDNLAINAIDGNYNNRWHSNVNAPVSPYPHWLTIDLGGEVTITRFCIWGSKYALGAGQIVDDRLPSEFKLLGRTEAPSDPDNDNDWTVLGEFECNYAIPGEQRYDIAVPTKARYFKFVATKGGADATIISLGEIDIYTE